MLSNLDPTYSLAQDIADLKRRVAALDTQDVLPNSAIGAGGLTVEGNGSIWIDSPGTLYVAGVDLATLSQSVSSEIYNTGDLVASGTWTSAARPTLTVSTTTGKLLVTIMANLSTQVGYLGGAGGATFSIAGYVNRATQLAGLTGAGARNGFCMRAVTATVWDTVNQGSAYSQLVTGLPLNTPLTITYEVTSTGGTPIRYYNAQLIAQVVA